MAPETDYEGLTPDELEALTASSAQRPDEDGTEWAARAAREAADAKATAAARKKAADEAEAAAQTAADEAKAAQEAAEAAQAAEGHPAE